LIPEVLAKEGRACNGWGIDVRRDDHLWAAAAAAAVEAEAAEAEARADTKG
jgi:hypothetical protein